MTATRSRWDLFVDVTQHLTVAGGFSVDEACSLTGMTRAEVRRAIAEANRKRPKLCSTHCPDSLGEPGFGPLCPYCSHVAELATRVHGFPRR